MQFPAPPPTSDPPTAGEVLQWGLARSVGALTDALVGLTDSVGQDRALRRAHLAARDVDGILQTFGSLLAAPWTAGLIADLSTLRQELDRVRASQVVRDRVIGWDPDGSPGSALPLATSSRGQADLVAAAQQRLSLDRIALRDLLDRPASVALLGQLSLAATDALTTPQAGDPAEEQLLAPVGKAWWHMVDQAEGLPSRRVLGAADASGDEWVAVAACGQAALRAWSALGVIRPLTDAELTGPAASSVLGCPESGPWVKVARRRARRLHRLTAEMAELPALQLWLNEVAVRAHGETAFAAGRLADVIWRQSRPSKKAWKKARRIGRIETPWWLG